MCKCECINKCINCKEGRGFTELNSGTANAAATATISTEDKRMYMVVVSYKDSVRENLEIYSYGLTKAQAEATVQEARSPYINAHFEDLEDIYVCEHTNFIDVGV